MKNNKEIDQETLNIILSLKERLNLPIEEVINHLKSIAAQKEMSLPKYLEYLKSNQKQTKDLKISNNGKYRVIGVDKYNNSDWVEGEYNTAEEALKKAREKTKEHQNYTTGPNIATVFYAYDLKGNYLGGDVWNNE